MVYGRDEHRPRNILLPSMTFCRVSRLEAMVLLLVILCVGVGIAQSQSITVDSKPTTDEMQQWAESGDPRLVAWAAYFANQTGDPGVMQAIAGLAERWEEPASSGAESLQQRKAMQEVLDTLIQHEQHVSARNVLTIGHLFPAEAAILASRLSEPDRTRVLLEWYRQRGKPGAWLPRVAAMMLAKKPPPGFAATVLEEMEVHLRLLVSDSAGIGAGASSSCSGGCAFPTGWSVPQWPPVFGYVLQENRETDQDPIVVESGEDRITLHRLKLGLRPCITVRPLNGDTRLGLIAEMSGTTQRGVGWFAEASDTIVFQSPTQFQSALGKLLWTEETKFGETAKLLCQRGALTIAEAQDYRPRLSVILVDMRKEHVPALPPMIARDPRTTITLGQP